MIRQFNELLEALCSRIDTLEERQTQIMATLTALDEAVNTLTTDVTAAVEALGKGPTQAEVDAVTTKVTEASQKLSTATTAA